MAQRTAAPPRTRLPPEIFELPVEKMREGSEQLSEHVRYIYIPGGGNTFIRKEDIAIALDEETQWIERFISNEAGAIDVNPWEYYRTVADPGPVLYHRTGPYRHTGPQTRGIRNHRAGMDHACIVVLLGYEKLHRLDEA